MDINEIVEVCKERNAIQAYLQGDPDRLANLLIEKQGQVLSPELAEVLSQIVRGEKLRGRGRPRGSRQDDAETRAIICVQITFLRGCGKTLEEAFETVGSKYGRTARTIRRYYEGF